MVLLFYDSNPELLLLLLLLYFIFNEKHIACLLFVIVILSFETYFIYNIYTFQRDTQGSCTD